MKGRGRGGRGEEEEEICVLNKRIFPTTRVSLFFEFEFIIC